MDSASSRRTVLLWAAGCVAALLAILIPVELEWRPLVDLDRWVGTGPQRLAYEHDWIRHLALAVQWLFEFKPMLTLTVVTAVALFWRNHRRAAAYVVAVMATNQLLMLSIKALIARDRPVWDEPVEILATYSFPSGHAAGIAASGSVAIVLALMLVRRRAVRRLIGTLAILLAFLVGLDRIVLGVHNLSDVVAGWLLGTTVALVWLALFDPEPTPLAQTTEALPEVYPSKTKLTVVLNPVKVDDPGGFRSMVEALARESGWKRVEWLETTVEDPGVGQAHQAAVTGSDLVITCGGDGTVRAVCEELAGTGIPVGIVPAGTGNLLARNLDLPLYLRSAVDTALNGQDRAIDMVNVTGDNMEDATFMVMAGMGFDAAIMEGVNDNIKAKVGWIAYVLSAIRSLMFPAVGVEISVDGGEFTKHRTRTVVIGNVGFLQAGMPLIPDAEIDDGELDVVLLYPRRFLSWLPLAVRVLSRSRRTDETITRMRGRRVTVRAGFDTPRQLDGDLIESGKGN